MAAGERYWGEGWNPIGTVRQGKGIRVSSVESLRALANPAGLPFATAGDRQQEYLPPVSAGSGSGIDAAFVDPSANRPRNEMIFERVAARAILAGRSRSCWNRAPLPVGPWTKCRPKICIAPFRISLKFMLKPARRRSASSHTRLARWGNGREANGMSAGG
jgi:hypothetical protein